MIDPNLKPKPTVVRSKAFCLMFAFLGLGVLVIGAAVIALVAALNPSTNPQGTPITKLTVTITLPQNGSQFQEGQDVLIQSRSANGSVTRFELMVDDKIVRADRASAGQFYMSQTWKATQGTHKVSVRVFDASDVASNSADIVIVVSRVVALVSTPIVPPLGVPSITNTATLTPILPTQTNTPLGVPISTSTPTLTAIPPTPTLASAPDIYVTAIRTDPPGAGTGIPIAFNVTFLNTTNGTRGITWRLAIFKVGGPANSLGDTPIQNNVVPLGAQELRSGTWRSPKECLQLFANVFLVDPSTKQRIGPVLKTDRSGPFQFNFQTCQ